MVEIEGSNPVYNIGGIKNNLEIIRFVVLEKLH